MGTQWEHWGDKGGEERNWPPYLTCRWLSISVLSNRHSLRTKAYGTTFTFFTLDLHGHNQYNIDYSVSLLFCLMMKTTKQRFEYLPLNFTMIFTNREVAFNSKSSSMYIEQTFKMRCTTEVLNIFRINFIMAFRLVFS